MNELEKVLEKYIVDSADEFIQDDFEETIKKALPGYDITVWDEDEGNFGQSVGDTIAATVQGKTVEDIQTMEWCTEECDCYMYVVAIKIKEE